MKLDKFGNVNAMEVFTLAPSSRALVTAILLSAVKVERLEKQSGGLYDKLYLSMNFLLAECIKQPPKRTSLASNGLYKQYRSLLAAEVVLLMCYVPSFADYLQKEPGVMTLATTATSDVEIVKNVSTLKADLDKKNVSKPEQIKALGQFIQSAVMFSLAKTPEKAIQSPSEEQKIFSKKPLPKRPMSGPVFSSSYHMKGQTSPNTNPPRITSAKPERARQPDVGETVLTSPQCLARVVSLPQPDIALVLLEMIPVNGAMQSKAPSFEEHYAYIDTRELIWDSAKSYWKPRGTLGNRVSLRYVKKNELVDDTVSDMGSSEVTVCHHSIGGKATPITVPMPSEDECDVQGLVVDTDIARDRLTVSPRAPSSVPTFSPIHSPPPSRQQALPPGEVQLQKLSIADEKGNSNNNNNPAATPIGEKEVNPEVSSPTPRTPKQLSVVQIGVTIPPKLSHAPSANDVLASAQSPPPQSPGIRRTPCTLTYILFPFATECFLEYNCKSPTGHDVTSDENVASNATPLNTSAEFTLDDGDSDEDELSALAREDLIRDTLSTTDLEMGIAERHVAPSNSPDLRACHSRVSNQTSSRQPSANINSVYKMLRAEETFRASARHHQVGYGDNIQPKLRHRNLEWDLKIFDPDCTPNVSVKWANLWMGGGRDLHSEEMKKRPNSAHVPGWKEGLKGAPRTLSAHTTRYLSTGKSGSTRTQKIHNLHATGQSKYDQQLAFQQYKFLPQQTSYQRTFLSTRSNMRDKKQLLEVQREMAWTEYVKNAMVHRALQ
ncbi:uncharacterized protein [Watersipora subatra]|uniref:uncharacterized protein n=1 Tax=Watersipora subatra TaxID=2589382 RepID=UPI00355AD420